MTEAGEQRPEYFYKYMPFNAARTVLETRKLRWTDPAEFSDPLDVSLNILDTIDRAELGTILPAADDPLDYLLMHCCTLLPFFRILCFSSKCDVAPMWAHYADQHRGVVLKFRANDRGRASSPWINAQRIRYEDKLLLSAADVAESLKQDGKNEQFRHFLQKWLCVKHPDWRHEYEWRCFTLSNFGEPPRYCHWGVDENDFEGVYFGLNASEQNKAELIFYAGKYPNMKFFNSRIDGTKLVFDEWRLG